MFWFLWYWSLKESESFLSLMRQREMIISWISKWKKLSKELNKIDSLLMPYLKNRVIESKTEYEFWDDDDSDSVTFMPKSWFH